MPTLEELNAMLADPGFQERHKEFERQMYERLEPLGNAIQKMKKPTPPSRQDPDLMTEEELLAAFEAMPLPARQEAMKRALDEEMGPVAVMSPTSGVTSIPLGSPWPPLSREQVVKLHEALVMWRRAEERVGAHTRAEYNARNPANVDDQLLDLLVRLGIGSPPPTRTWTHEEIAKVAEEVQQRSGLPRHAEGRAPTTATELAITAAMEDRFGHITDLSRHSKPREEPTTDEDSGPGAMSWQRAEEFGSPFAAAVEPAWLRSDWGSVQMPVRNLSEQGLAEGQMVTTAQVQVVPETRPPYLWTPDGKFRAMSPGEVASIVERADGKPTFRVTQGDAMPAGTDRDYLLVASAPDVPRRQEGRWEEPPKRNCWTCDHDKVFGGGTAHICTALPPRRSKGTGDSPTVKAISAWTDSQTLDASLMPPKDSDGCPGWEPKP